MTSKTQATRAPGPPRAHKIPQPLPIWLRERFERAAGTGLGAVRVAEAAWVADAGARAFCRGDELWLAPGAYRPDSDAGAQLLAHEVAHVLQQRAGRVPTGAGIVDDPALEAEADAIAADLVRGRPPRHRWLDRRVAATGPAPFQPYRIIPNAQLAAEGINLGNATFPGQECGVANGAASQDSFLRANGDVNLRDQPHAQVELRLSDTGELAIEHCNLHFRQAKVFFATDERITVNNRELNKFDSRFRLVKVEAAANTPRAITLTRDGRARQLFQVQMGTVDGRVYSSTANNCNEVAGETMGVQLDYDRTARVAPRVPGVLSRLLARIQRSWTRPLPTWTLADALGARLALYVTTLAEGRDAAAALVAARDMPSDLKLIQDANARTQDEQIAAIAAHYDPLGQRYGLLQRATQTAYVDACRGLGVNEWADPVVGDAFYTVSIYGLQRNARRDLYGTNFVENPQRVVTPCWEFHWGAVAAKKGCDRIIFENYARTSEDVGVTQRANGHRAFFEMYEVPNGTDATQASRDKTWHHTWRDTGFANPITLAVTRL